MKTETLNYISVTIAGTAMSLGYFLQGNVEYGIFSLLGIPAYLVSIWIITKLPKL